MSTEIEETEKKVRKPNTLILEIEGVKVTRDSMCYMVDGGLKKRTSYFPNLESSCVEVSERLFHGKLTKRAEEGKADLQSLVKLIETHKSEIREKFSL